MPVRDPLSQFATHEVTNQPPPLEDTNLFDGDAPLREALRREGADWATDEVRAFGGLRRPHRPDQGLKTIDGGRRPLEAARGGP